MVQSRLLNLRYAVQWERERYREINQGASQVMKFSAASGRMCS